MIALLCITALLAGPALFALVQRSGDAGAFIDGAVRFLVVGIVLLHVIPEALAHVGLMGAAVVLFGGWLSQQLDRPGIAWGVNGWTVGAAVALGAHSFLDGIAVSTPTTSWLVMAVILHTLPVGMLTWEVLVPRLGASRTWIVLGAGALGTALGATVGAEFVHESGEQLLMIIQALVAGTLLHIVSHTPISPTRGWHILSHDPAKSTRWASGVGAIFGAILVGYSLHLHSESTSHSDGLGFEAAWFALVSWTAPAMVLAVLGLIGHSERRWPLLHVLFRPLLVGLLFGPLIALGLMWIAWRKPRYYRYDLVNEIANLIGWCLVAAVVEAGMVVIPSIPAVGLLSLLIAGLSFAVALPAIGVSLVGAVLVYHGFPLPLVIAVVIPAHLGIIRSRTELPLKLGITLLSLGFAVYFPEPPLPLQALTWTQAPELMSITVGFVLLVAVSLTIRLGAAGVVERWLHAR